MESGNNTINSSGESGGLIHPRHATMQPVSGPRLSVSAAPSASIHFEIPREKRKKKNPPDDRSHSSMRACIQRSLLHESLYLSAPAAPADVTSVWGAAPALLRSTGSGFVWHWHAARGRVHVFLHGAASAHPQSPRIGRTLLSSLGELTGGAGLRRHEGCARFIRSLGDPGTNCRVGMMVLGGTVMQQRYYTFLHELV